MKTSHFSAAALFFTVTIFSCQTESDHNAPIPQEKHADAAISSVYEKANPLWTASAEEDHSTARLADATSAQEKLILTYINQARSKSCKCGTQTYKAVGDVTLSAKLSDAANKHAVSMAKYDYFSHTGRNGSSPGQRITAENYVWKTYGENIAAGYDTAKETVAAWMKSEGHCKNIMNGSFKNLGVGYGYKSGSTYKHYWVTDFATRN